ncbi:hypothetical protein D6833_09730 [Candidatus Parcubacteria bacterium]|nr:MAG: hypothetical protein D6833_09730 [Candidatus Parcubacteria bacterium]
MKTVTVTFSSDKIAERTARTLRRRSRAASEELMDVTAQSHRYHPLVIERLNALASIERVSKRGRSVVITVADDGDGELLRSVATATMHAAGVVGKVEYS